MILNEFDPRRSVALARMMRIAGNQQFGCSGMHHGRGTPDCPRELHHHHDEFCNRPVIDGGE